MDIVWVDADTVEKLNAIALYEGETHVGNSGSDLEGALARPTGVITTEMSTPSTTMSRCTRLFLRRHMR